MSKIYRGMICLSLVLIATLFVNGVANSQWGSALMYNGSNQYADYGTVVSTLTDSITLEAWVKWKGTTGHSQGIVYNGNTGSTGYGLYISEDLWDGYVDCLAILAGGLEIMHVLDGGGNPYVLPLNTWVHLAIVSNAGHWSVYANGTALTSLDSYDFTPSTPSGDFVVGASNVATEEFNGVIEEVRFSSSVRYMSNFTPPSAPFTTDANTIALYHFNEDSGSVALDASTNNDTLTLVNSPSWVTPSWVATLTATDVTDTTAVLHAIVDPNGSQRVVHFDWGTSTSYGSASTNDTVDDPGSALLLSPASHQDVQTSLTDLSGTEITIEYWFKGSNPQSAVRQQANEAIYIVAGWWTGSSFVHILSNDEGLNNGIPVGSGVVDGNWHHVAMTWKMNTENGFRSYLDGNLVAQRTSSNSPIPNMSTNVFMGSLWNAGEFTNGIIDEVRIWGLALGQDTLKAWMNRRITSAHPAYAHLTGYWRFDEGTGTTAGDSSGNGHDGTLENGPSWVRGGRVVSASLSSLSASTMYHYRIAAINASDTSMGFDDSLTTEGPLPIQLASMTATTLATGVQLQWTTVSETNSLGFYVERKAQNTGTYATVSNLIAGAGTTLQQHHYQWTDTKVTNGNYNYRFRLVDLNGSTTYSNAIAVTVSGVQGVGDKKPLPTEFALHQNYPNPFNPSTIINYDLPKAAYVHLTVYDILGREVATLVNGAQDAGYKSVEMDASNMPSGLYIYRLTAGTYTSVRKMLLIK